MKFYNLKEQWTWNGNPSSKPRSCPTWSNCH